MIEYNCPKCNSGNIMFEHTWHKGVLNTKVTCNECGYESQDMTKFIKVLPLVVPDKKVPISTGLLIDIQYELESLTGLKAFDEEHEDELKELVTDLIKKIDTVLK